MQPGWLWFFVSLAFKENIQQKYANRSCLVKKNLHQISCKRVVSKKVWEVFFTAVFPILAWTANPGNLAWHEKRGAPSSPMDFQGAMSTLLHPSAASGNSSIVPWMSWEMPWRGGGGEGSDSPTVIFLKGSPKGSPIFTRNLGILRIPQLPYKWHYKENLVINYQESFWPGIGRQALTCTAWRVIQNSKMIWRNMEPMCRLQCWKHPKRPRLSAFRLSHPRSWASHKAHRREAWPLPHGPPRNRCMSISPQGTAQLETVKPRAVSSPPASVVKCPQADMKGLEKITTIAGERREWYVKSLSGILGILQSPHLPAS